MPNGRETLTARLSRWEARAICKMGVGQDLACNMSTNDELGAGQLGSRNFARVVASTGGLGETGAVDVTRANGTGSLNTLEQHVGSHVGAVPGTGGWPVFGSPPMQFEGKWSVAETGAIHTEGWQMIQVSGASTNFVHGQIISSHHIKMCSRRAGDRMSIFLSIMLGLVHVGLVINQFWWGAVGHARELLARESFDA